MNEICGNDEPAIRHQAGQLLKTFDEDQREKILKEANIPQIEINSETMVAMKVDLSIPWEKLNAMKRYI